MLYIGNPPKGEMSQSALLKDQNTKTSLYKLSKNHWVIALFKKFGSVRKKYNLQSLWITMYQKYLAAKIFLIFFSL